jgi:hypothetical protein
VTGAQITHHTRFSENDSWSTGDEVDVEVEGEVDAPELTACLLLKRTNLLD